MWNLIFMPVMEPFIIAKKIMMRISKKLKGCTTSISLDNLLLIKSAHMNMSGTHPPKNSLLRLSTSQA